MSANIPEPGSKKDVWKTDDFLDIPAHPPGLSLFEIRDCRCGRTCRHDGGSAFEKPPNVWWSITGGRVLNISKFRLMAGCIDSVLGGELPTNRKWVHVRTPELWVD